jgi:hypothetical protein
MSAFWSKVSDNWNEIYALLSSGKLEGVSMLESYLVGTEYESKVNIECSFGEINSIHLEQCKDIVEMYLSPCFNKSNISIMEKLYNSRVKLSNCNVNKYRAWNKNSKLIEDLYFNLETEPTELKAEELKAEPKPTELKPVEDKLIVPYTSLGYQGFVSYDETKNPQLNIVIIVEQPLASQILTKKRIDFTSEGKQTSRDVYIQHEKYNFLDIYLNNIVGEFHFLNSIGYIELLPSDDPIITKESVFTELVEMREDIELVLKYKNYKKCQTCSKITLQCDIYKCKCKKANCLAYYCSVICQRINWPDHKN